MYKYDQNVPQKSLDKIHTKMMWHPLPLNKTKKEELRECTLHRTEAHSLFSK